MSITKHKFRIGDVVLVKGEVVITEEDRVSYRYHRKVNRHELPESAWYRAVVTGAGTRCEGVRNYIGPEEGSSFETKKVVQVWFVRPSVCSKERAVFEEDLELVPPYVRYENPPDRVTAVDIRRIPWKLVASTIAEGFKQEMREIMDGWPRDAKGHWKRMPSKVSFSIWLKGQADDPEIGELARTVKELSASPHDLYGLRGVIMKHAAARLEPQAVRAWHRWFEEGGL